MSTTPSCSPATDDATLAELAEELSPYVCRVRDDGRVRCHPDYATPVYDVDARCRDATTQAACGQMSLPGGAPLCRWA